ncbi:GNAT family N-acetyltransferase [Streptomyces sp. HPF1205]|uniref:GNAT family N-acetyltransferase n=1 Tax=Streptomyces sp. HPF1205 TaxID=2873262 RepID=UPI001CECB98C|nr:GNAT family N-acetyltransferase [Streptomyces sp. HPF1205]
MEPMEPMEPGEYEIRTVRPAEWRKIREVRLTALQDPVAVVAFARSYAEEAALPDEEWQRRASGAGAQQFAVIRPRTGDGGGNRGGDGDGEEERAGEDWVGMAVVIAERPDYLSVNAVYLRPEVRGTGLAERLFATVAEWTWERADRLHLWVHQDNPRAEALYRRVGFVRTGRSMAHARTPMRSEYEMVLTRG